MDLTAGDNVLSDKGHLHASSIRPSLSFLSIISQPSPLSLFVLYYFEMGDKVSCECCHHFHLMSAWSLSAVRACQGLHSVLTDNPRKMYTVRYSWQGLALEKEHALWMAGRAFRVIVLLPSETWVNPTAELEC